MSCTNRLLYRVLSSYGNYYRPRSEISVGSKIEEKIVALAAARDTYSNEDARLTRPVFSELARESEQRRHNWYGDDKWPDDEDYDDDDGCCEDGARSTTAEKESAHRLVGPIGIGRALGLSRAYFKTAVLPTRATVLRHTLVNDAHERRYRVIGLLGRPWQVSTENCRRFPWKKLPGR